MGDGLQWSYLRIRETAAHTTRPKKYFKKSTDFNEQDEEGNGSRYKRIWNCNTFPPFPSCDDWPISKNSLVASLWTLKKRPLKYFPYSEWISSTEMAYNCLRVPNIITSDVPSSAISFCFSPWKRTHLEQFFLFLTQFGLRSGHAIPKMKIQVCSNPPIFLCFKHGFVLSMIMTFSLEN